MWDNIKDGLLWLLIAALALFGVVCFTGCGTLIPQKRTENASVKTAEVLAVQSAQTFEKITDGDKPQPIPVPPNLSVAGTNNHVDVKIDYAGAFSSADSGPASRPIVHRETVRASSGVNSNSTSTEDSSGFLKKSFPLWVGLIGVGVGVIILVFAVKYARNSSPAINAAWNAGDEALAKSVRFVEDHLKSATTDSERAKFASIRADMEKERGKLMRVD